MPMGFTLPGDRIETELNAAELARSSGNEGRSRVHARRAVGIAIREYLSQRNQPVIPASAYDLLGVLENMDDMPDPVRQAATRLRMRVDTHYQLPEGIDLMSDARLIIVHLSHETHIE